jgi:hypothetical protein
MAINIGNWLQIKSLGTLFYQPTIYLYLKSD